MHSFQENSTATERSFSLLEVHKHTQRSDCWTVIHGNVYDFTKFANSLWVEGDVPAAVLCHTPRGAGCAAHPPVPAGGPPQGGPRGAEACVWAKRKVPGGCRRWRRGAGVSRGRGR
mmetsp:Transcript_13988/g.48198  ORF Transcript_13988/g.48198 Transcript_13988/m.48198 type:complete len:116 (-) Transcript_13988:851-1198(-)